MYTKQYPLNVVAGGTKVVDGFLNLTAEDQKLYDAINEVDANKETPAGAQAKVDAGVASIVNSSPATLDTLNELAAALGDDPNFATTVTNLIGTKAPQATTYNKTETDTVAQNKADTAQTAAALDATNKANMVQSILETTNLESTGYGVISGCEILPQDTPDMTVKFGTMGTNRIHMPSGKAFTIAANSAITITTADTTNPRIDLIYIDADGVLQCISGTPASSPVSPTLPTGCFAEYNISVVANQTTITASNITDLRIFKPNYQNHNVLNIKDFGAHSITETGYEDFDSTIAINLAIQKAVSLSCAVYIPSGIYLVSNFFTLTTYHNGLSVFGNGFNSCIKIKDGAVQTLGTTFYLFYICDSNHSNQIKNISISNLQIDGNKGNNTGTSYGITTYQHDDSPEYEDIIIDKIWAHDFGGDAFYLCTSKTTVSNIHSWDNVGHGFGIAGGNGVLANNIVCEGNGQYGIDAHGGMYAINNFYCKNNSAGGAKVAENGVYGIWTNGILVNNRNNGFITNADFNELYLDNIYTTQNDLAGVNIRNVGNVHIGSIVSNGDNTLGTVVAGVILQYQCKVHADSITVLGAKGYGIYTTLGSYDINHVNIQNCTSHGIYSDNSVKIIIKGGTLYNNTGYGAYFNNVTKKVTIENVSIGDNQTTKTQTTGLYICSPYVDVLRCDFSESNSPFNLVSCAHFNVDKCVGYITSNSGIYTTNGDGSKTQFSFPHGLSAQPTSVIVIPGYFTQQTTFSVMVDATNINVYLGTAPTSGTNNVRFFWKASFHN